MPKILKIGEILEEQNEFYVVRTKTGTKKFPRSAYFDLKHVMNDGERIYHDFGNGLIIHETYNDGIFNTFVGKKVFQIYDANTLAELILKNDAVGFKELWKEWYGATIQDEYVKTMWSPFAHRIDMESEPNHYIVDGVFKIDDKGAAYYKNGETPRGKSLWASLCLVVKTRPRSMEVYVPSVGTEITISSLTGIVMSKIAFCLFPNDTDHIFMDQLPKGLQKHVKDVVTKDKKRQEEIKREQEKFNNVQ